MARRGRVFQRGNIWWIQFYLNGKDHRESTGSIKRKVAEKLLTKRMAAKEAGTLSEAAFKPLRFEDLHAAIRRDYLLEENRSTNRMEDAFKALVARFAGWKTAAITEKALGEYIDERLALGRAKATVLYELRMLRRAFRLAKAPCPFFPSIAVNNVRKHFFEPEEYRAVIAQLPNYLRPVMTAAYYMGWRVQSELLPLQWKHVNVDTGIAKLEIGSTKNGRGRSFPFGPFPELAALFDERKAETERLQRERGIVIPHVFYRVTRTAVVPIRSYKNAWASACRRAGLPGRWVHDFRRCGARALRDAAVPESVAMELLGHKTPSIFKRYQIANDADLKAGVEKLAAFHAHQANYGTNYGTVTQLPAGRKTEAHG